MKPSSTAHKLSGSLSKLSQAASANKDRVSGTIVFISPKDCIEVTNPRKKFDQELIEAYTEQFLDPQEGQHEPITVYPADSEGKHRIHQGATRYRAGINALIIKPDFKLKAYIDHSLINKSEFQRYYEQGANNILRDNMSVLDRAHYFAELLEISKREGVKITQVELAKRFGWKDSSVISRHLKLCKMSPEVLAIYEAGKTDDLDSLTTLMAIQEKNPGLFSDIAALPVIDRATIRRANTTGSLEPTEPGLHKQQEGITTTNGGEQGGNTSFDETPVNEQFTENTTDDQLDDDHHSTTQQQEPTTRKKKVGQLTAVVFVDVKGEEGVLLLKVPKDYIGAEVENIHTNGFVYVQIGSEIRVVKEGEYVIKKVSYRE